MFQRLRERFGRGAAAAAREKKLSQRIARIEADLHALAKGHEDVLRHLRQLTGTLEGLARIEQEVAALTGQHTEVARQLRRLQAGVDGIVRAEYLQPGTLPFPQRLTAGRFRLHSQNSEDGILLALFRQIGVASGRFVELGSGSSGGNAAMFAAEFGWTGLMVEGDAGKAGMAARRESTVVPSMP